MAHRAPTGRPPRPWGKIIGATIAGVVLLTGLGLGAANLSSPSPSAPQPYHASAQPFRSPLPPKPAARATRAVQVAPTEVVATAPGMTLWALAKADCGDGAAWTALYAANKAVVGADPGFLRVGEHLAIKCR
jgi:nucleoid-associated protein YgaU